MTVPPGTLVVLMLRSPSSLDSASAVRMALNSHDEPSDAGPFWYSPDASMPVEPALTAKAIPQVLPAFDPPGLGHVPVARVYPPPTTFLPVGAATLICTGTSPDEVSCTSVVNPPVEWVPVTIS